VASNTFGKFISDSVKPPEIDVFGILGYVPTERQKVFHAASAERIDAILYGGAAGGGKTAAFLMDALYNAANFPGIKIGCFRRSYPELEESFLAQLTKWNYGRDLGAKWNSTNKVLKFANGSVINFTYAENLVDASRILGGEYQAFYIDEASQMMPAVIQHIEERLRSGNRLVPVIGLRLATNPGGIGHKYLKDRFINPTKRGKIRHEEKIGDGKNFRSVVFIQAKVTDNPHVNEGYHAVLDSIPDPRRRAAMRDGDWDAMVGQFFEQWQYSKHVVPSFKIPKEWPRYAGIDYGFKDPFAVVWVAIDNDGRMWVYREICVSGYNSDEQAKIIIATEQGAGETEVVRVADPSMWGSRGTPFSIADDYGINGCGIMPANNDRINGWARVHQYLNDAPACEYHRLEGKDKCPMLHVFEDKCPMFIEQIPALPRSAAKPDDAETRNVDDHIADALRYVCMYAGVYARPIIYGESTSLFTTKVPDTMVIVKEDEAPPLRQPNFGGLFIGDLGLSPF